MKISEIHLRDPFIMVENGQYYLYGSRGRTAWGEANGFDVFISKDLETWSDAIEVFHTPEGFWSDRHYWAPEVHKYKGKYYMFASFKSETACRGTQILIADKPEGPFRVHSDGPVTPRDWECLDGTLYIEDGKPYMVFCHEWLQITDGTMCAIPLTDDLKAAAGDAVVLFRGSDPAWMEKGQKRYITDGPFLYRTAEGKLLMLWSSVTEGRYVEAIAESESGTIAGPWKHQEKLLFEKDGGHGMIFRTLDGELMFTCHAPNKHPDERPAFFKIAEKDGSLILL